MHAMICLLLITNSAANAAAEERAPLSAHARSVLSTVLQHGRPEKVDVHLRMDSQAIVDDLGYSILPDPNVPGLNEQAQLRRFREIRERILKSGLQGIGPIDEANSFIRPSRFIKSKTQYEVRIEVQAKFLQQAIVVMSSIHPAVSEIHIEALEKMVLVQPDDPPSFDADQTGVSLCAVGASNATADLTSGEELTRLGSTASTVIFAATPRGVVMLRKLSEEPGVTLKPATSGDLASIRTPATVSIQQKQSIANLRKLIPKARVLKNAESTVRLALNDIERGILTENGYVVRAQ